MSLRADSNVHGMRVTLTINCPCDKCRAAWDGPCQWFALCENKAAATRWGPVGDGRFGQVPICDRCNKRIEALEAEGEPRVYLRGREQQ